MHDSIFENLNWCKKINFQASKSSDFYIWILVYVNVLLINKWVLGILLGLEFVEIPKLRILYSWLIRIKQSNYQLMQKA